MAEEPLLRRVEISFVGAAPAQQVERASGVSEVETDGSVLRCLVCGSFQSFLEALRGHEVVGFSSTPALSRKTPPAPASPSTTGTCSGTAR